MNRICIDCGSDYSYDADNPLGSSSLRCCRCRQKNSAFAKRARLFEIAGGRCAKCGYSGSIEALKLIDAVLPINGPPKTQEEKELQAHKQYTICLNCDAEINAKMYLAKIVSVPSAANPDQKVVVEFYLKDVQVVYTKVEPPPETITDTNLEIVTDETQGQNARRGGREAPIPQLPPAR